MTDFNDDMNRVLKYSRTPLPVMAMHPELRFTRLGAFLRHYATEPSEVGELAHAALTSKPDQPLDLMPLHLLRDKMQEQPDHPLAKEFEWHRLPEQVVLDSMIHKHVNEHPSNFRDAGEEYPEILRINLGATGDLGRMKQAVPDMDASDVEDAINRHIDQRYNRASAAQQVVAGFKNAPEEMHDSYISNPYFFNGHYYLPPHSRYAKS